ncbi:MAG: DUF72 domain-containing protein [Sulfolobales archaeon]
MIYVGCCGFNISRNKYYDLFNTVELQETFYDPPNLEKLKKLRHEAPSNFIYTMKCWQAITHPLDSPTWKRSRVKLPPTHKDLYGFLRPTKEVLKAWELVVEGVKTLNARVLIIQTPPSFNLNDENFKNAKDFFSTVSSSNFIIGWEPRGTWLDNKEKIAEIIGNFKNLIHITDPFKYKPALVKDVNYFRLHGLGGELNYRYKYSDNDLETLCRIVTGFMDSGKEIYVMFNNIYMVEDALRFKQRCVSKSVTSSIHE